MTRLSICLWAIKLGMAAGSLLFGAEPRDATYRVAVEEGNGVTTYGTGTGISEHYLATNSHVVNHRTGTRCTVYNTAGRYAGCVIAASPAVDLAIVQVASGGLSYVPVAEADPKAGDRVSIYGYGMQNVLRGGTGTVQAIRFYRSAGCPIIDTDLAIEDGDSGSGMFSATGELVAVQWCRDPIRGDRSGATPVSCLRKLTAAWETQYCPGGQCGILPRRYSGIGIVGPRGGAIGIGSVSPARPLVPVQPQPQQPARPQQPIQPVQPPQSDLSAVLASINERLAALEAREPMPGPPGPAGPPGEAGFPGRTPTIDYDAIASAVVRQLPPTRVVFEDGAGSPAAVQEVAVGGELRIPPARLSVIAENGSVQSTAKPLGEPLRLQLRDVKVLAP